MWFAQESYLDSSYNIISESSTNTGFLTASMFVVFGVALLLLVLIFASFWKIFVKAGQPGWTATVPGLSSYFLFQIIGWPTWWVAIIYWAPFGLSLVFGLFAAVLPVLIILLYLIVVAAFLVLWCAICLELGKVFGKSKLFSIFGLILFPIIGLPMLGFGNDKYLGVSNKPAKQETPVQA